LGKVSGLDPTTALALIVGIEDISRFETPSKVWAYCGMHTYMIDVKSQRRWFETQEIAIRFVRSILRHKRGRSENHVKSYEEEQNELLNLCVWGSGYITKTIAARDGVGKLENWNKFLKKICKRIGENFDNDPANGFYHQQLRLKEINELQKMSVVDGHHFEQVWLSDPRLRLNLDRQLPKGTLAKANSRAQRDTVRLFLSHFFQYWRQVRGLPNKKPQSSRGGEIIAFPGIPLEFSVF